MIEVDARDLRRLVISLKKASDGKELRKDLVRGLKAAVEPAAKAAKASILSMSSSGSRDEEGTSLRAAVAAAVKTQVRTVGSRAGVYVVAGRSGMPRGFLDAPKRLNAKRWRHPVFGNRKKWVTQVGKPGWFDKAMDSAKPATVRAAKEAMDNVAQRIDHQTRG